MEMVKRIRTITYKNRHVIGEKMRIINKFNDDIGSIFDYNTKQIYLMLKYKNCTIKED